MTLEELQAQRTRILAEIKRRGGVANAPKFAEQLKGIEGQIRQARGGGQAAQSIDLGVDQKTGVIDAEKLVPAVTGAEQKDAETTFNMNNPAVQTDQSGNTQTVTKDPTTGQVTVQQTGGALSQGAQGFLQGAIGNAQGAGQLDLSGLIKQLGGQKLDLSGAPQILQANDVRAQADQVADANYRYLTKDLGAQKKQELEERKQELAQRGIPINFGGDDLYSRGIKDIDDKYKSFDDQARMQALMSRDQSLGALTGAQKTAYDSFLQGATTSYDAATGNLKDQAALGSLQAQNAQNQVGTAISALGATQGQFTPYQGGSVDQSSVLAQLAALLSGAAQGAYGINTDKQTKLAAINKPSGGGGGGGGSGFGITIGGVAP